jgi:hypothetical protein
MLPSARQCLTSFALPSVVSTGAVPLALTEQLQAGIIEPKVNGAVMPGAAKLTIGEPTAQKNSTVGTASAGRQPSVNQGSLLLPLSCGTAPAHRVQAPTMPGDRDKTE